MSDAHEITGSQLRLGEGMNEEAKDLVVPQFIRSEVNLLVFPFFALNHREVTTRRDTEFEAIVNRDGKQVEISWIVSANARYGYPGPYDKQLFRAIEQVLSGMYPPIQNPIAFSTYQLCRLVGKGVGGRQYQGIKEILRRIVATTIQSHGAYFHKGRRRWVDDTFHLYDRVVFKGEEFPNGRVAETNYLFLSDWYLESLNNRYVKPIDYEYYQSLRSTIAGRLYELLGVKFYHVYHSNVASLRYRYSTLCQLLPIARQRYRSKAREKLDPAHNELIKTGFLSDVRWEDADGPDWRIRYTPGERLHDEIEAFHTPDDRLHVDVDDAEPIRAAPSEAEVEAFANTILEVTEDEHSRAFYRKICRRALREPKLYDLIFRALGEVKEDAREGRIQTSRGAVFTDRLKRHCESFGIDLGLSQPD